MTNKLIVSPGEYRTRDGRRVTIDTIYNGPIPHAFPCKGRVWSYYRGRQRPRGYFVWTEAGHQQSIGETPLDIVAPWENEDD